MTTGQRNDRDAELAVLAAMFRSPLARQEARRHITGADLYDPRAEAIWDAMTRLDRFNKPVDHYTLIPLLGQSRGAVDLLPDLVTAPVVPDTVGEYAEIVRGWAIRRRLEEAAIRVQQQALNAEANAVGFAAKVATEFAGIRDSGVADDVTAETIEELLAEPDDEPDWLIPDLLERRDRLMLTGEEGLGKSHLLRQIALLSAAGLHPFETTRMKPIKVLIYDCENSRGQVRRKMRPIYEFAQRHGLPIDGRLMVECSRRLDITRDKDLAQIHHLLDAQQPDLVVIGPLYRLVPRALQTDDEAAPVLAALDTIRDRDVALLIEAHAGHALGKGGVRDLRPRGSSALLGWPEFGYGLRADGKSYCHVVPWRGDRDDRSWPFALRRDSEGLRWLPTEQVIEWNGGAA